MILLLASAMLALPMLALPALALTAQEPSAADRAAVLATVQAMFDGMAHHDAAAVAAPWLPGGTLVLLRDGTPDRMTIEAFAAHIGKIPASKQIAETIHDPLVRVDHDLAVVWAPFTFTVDGKPDHCGTDLIDLVKTTDGWKIASVADTGRKDCAAR